MSPLFHVDVTTASSRGTATKEVSLNVLAVSCVQPKRLSLSDGPSPDAADRQVQGCYVICGGIPYDVCMPKDEFDQLVDMEWDRSVRTIMKVVAETVRKLEDL